MRVFVGSFCPAVMATARYLQRQVSGELSRPWPLRKELSAPCLARFPHAIHKGHSRDVTLDLNWIREVGRDYQRQQRQWHAQGCPAVTSGMGSWASWTWDMLLFSPRGPLDDEK